MTRSALDTPMMRQYLAIKAQHPDAIVFYRMGDFYEMFLRDAELAAPLLDIALTTRDKGKPDAVPMCGVPVHAVDAYVQRLAELGHRVAICEQVEDARRTGGRRLVRREVVEVVTPGLVGDPDGTRRGARELALAALLAPGAGDRARGARRLDGRPARDRGAAAARRGAAAARCSRSCGASSRARCCARRRARERSRPRSRALLPDAARTRGRRGELRAARAPAIPTASTRGATGAAPRAAAALLALPGRAPAVRAARRSRGCARYRALRRDGARRGDARAPRALPQTARTARARGTLIERIDRTRRRSARAGSRAGSPIRCSTRRRSRARQDAVAWLAERDRLRARLREALRRRARSRAAAREGGAPVARRRATSPRCAARSRRCRRCADALASGADEALLGGRRRAAPALPRARAAARAGASCCARRSSTSRRRCCAARAARARPATCARASTPSSTRCAKPPARAASGSPGLEARGARAHAASRALKIRFHPVHGYGIEITQGAARARARRLRAQADARERRALHDAGAARDRADTCSARTSGRRRSSARSSRRCASAALEHAARDPRRGGGGRRARRARVARRGGAAATAGCGPQVDASDGLEIRAGRHPVVEPLLAAQRRRGFVPNDTRARSRRHRRSCVLTGPEHVGQEHLPAPGGADRAARADRAASCRPRRRGSAWSIASSPASAPATGSRAASPPSWSRCARPPRSWPTPRRRSLVILDEIGRGTSTFDGLSIAWAVAEYLHDTPGARRAHAVRDPLPRAHRSRAHAARASRNAPLRGARVGRGRGLPAAPACRARRAAPTGSRWRGSRGCRRR